MSSSECGRAETLIAARAAGALAPESEPALAAHLARCAACLRVIRELDPDAEPGATAGDAACGFDELGVITAENYVRGAEIGRGGMGRITRAYDRRLGRVVAIKQLLDGRPAARFEHEARLTARLQHPAIVTVYEAGRWPTGEPFYAMKYVEGRPLDAVIANLDTLDARLTLLAHLTTVVEAIAYAHSERIVHRDLKPHNILVGPFGETVVIDWGLAKDLAATSAAEVTAHQPGAWLTQGGAGTPAYMAPEQARGEPPDERVDVYALGATLHHLLAGASPVDRPLPQDTPPDLRAIVCKAMADERGERYATAADLALELRRFQNGQLVASHRYTAGQLAGRWFRRHRSVALVTAGALMVVAVGGGLSVDRIIAERDRASQEKTIAESQRKLADAQRQGAERLVDFMLGTLHNRLEPIGKLELLAGLAEQVERYLSSVSDAGETDPAALGQRARAFHLLGVVHFKRSDLAAASAEFLRARELCERQQRLAPGSAAVACMAAAQSEIAAIESFRGDTKAALERWDQAAAVLDAAASRYPDDDGLHRLRGDLQWHRARELTKLDDYTRARPAFQEAITLAAKRVADSPTDTRAMDQLATAHAGLCMLEARDGRPDVALIHCQHAVEVRDQQRRSEPDSVEWEIGSASVMIPLADAALAGGDAPRARAASAAALVVLRPRAASDPTNGLWGGYLAGALGMQCASELALDHPKIAERVCADAAGGFEHLLRRDPGLGMAGLTLVSVDVRLAFAHLQQHQLAAAHAAAASAAQLADTWSRRQPSSAWLFSVHIAHHAVAMVARAAGRLGDARASAAIALDAAEAIARPGPTLQAEQALARAALLLADLDADAADRTAAEARLRAALSRLATATQRWPEVVDLAGLLAYATVRLSELVTDPAEARTLRARALRLLDPLIRRDALGAEFRRLRQWAQRARTR